MMSSSMVMVTMMAIITICLVSTAAGGVIGAPSPAFTNSNTTVVYRGTLIAVRYLVENSYQLIAVNPNDGSFKVLPYDINQWVNIHGHAVDESTNMYYVIANDGKGIKYIDKINMSTGMSMGKVQVRSKSMLRDFNYEVDPIVANSVIATSAAGEADELIQRVSLIDGTAKTVVTIPKDFYIERDTSSIDRVNGTYYVWLRSYTSAAGHFRSLVTIDLKTDKSSWSRVINPDQWISPVALSPLQCPASGGGAGGCFIGYHAPTDEMLEFNTASFQSRVIVRGINGGDYRREPSGWELCGSEGSGGAGTLFTIVTPTHEANIQRFLQIYDLSAATRVARFELPKGVITNLAYFPAIPY